LSGNVPLLVHVIGASNSGKTTLITRLIPQLCLLGVRVGTMKHAHHGFELDQPGKDSWKHAQAGAAAVAIVAPTQTAWIVQTKQELNRAEAMAQMAPHVDMLLVEGFTQDDDITMRITLGAAMEAPIVYRGARMYLSIHPADLTDEAVTALAKHLGMVIHAQGYIT
jgi:molybdopterin-guanine dinucleotide biosynthesis protein MobB